MRDIAIIGAGPAGIAAARALSAAGAAVCLFDKSRGFGGRCATRRVGDVALNHGAPAVQAGVPDGVQGSDDGFRDALLAAGGVEGRVEGVGGITGPDGLSPIMRAMAAGIPARLHTEIAEVRDEGGSLWLVDATGARTGPFDRAIVAVPAPQLGRIAPFDAFADGVREVTMAPLWTLLTTFDRPVTLHATGAPVAEVWPGLSGAGVPGTGVAGAGEAGAGVAGAGGPERASRGWIAHASAEWSLRHLEDDRGAVAARLLDAVRARTAPQDGAASDHVDPAMPSTASATATAHRWRYARVERALGRPFLAACDGRILAGGDWALGADARHAWASGVAMARRMIAR